MNTNAASQPEMPAGDAGYDPARLIQEHQTGVWRYLRALGCDASEADDLTQDTFLAVLRSDFRAYADAATAGYLRRVAYNLLVSNRRRAGKVTAVEDIEQFNTAWVALTPGDNTDELMDALRECFAQLTERARMALEMRFRDNATRDEIAAALEIGEHGAKNLMQRAKQQLRSCVEAKVG
ncbi:MAG: sigma-70 family RNA polymerase sigma factor [Planctomycetales bacterium]|nr:sigma-70 family RNA polymerase sigma factor [Planctomycetales bacterium]